MTRLLVDYDGIGEAGVVFDGYRGDVDVDAAEIVIAVVNEDPEEKANVSSKLMKKNARGGLTEDEDTQVQVHEFVNGRQMNDWRCQAIQE